MTSPATLPAAVSTEDEQELATALFDAVRDEAQSRPIRLIAQALATARTSARSAALEEAAQVLRSVFGRSAPIVERVLALKGT